MATVTLLGSTFNTTSGNHTVVATPTINDLIVVVSANTGNVGGFRPTDDNADGLGNPGFSAANASQALKNTSADELLFSVRTNLIGSGTSTTWTVAPGTTTGGGLAVYAVSGVLAAGSGGIRQYAKQSNQAGGGTPTPVFSSAVLTGNPVIAAVFNAANPAAMTPRSSPAYTEDVDTGWATPTTGIETMHIVSGETATSIAWGGTSGSAFASLAVELVLNAAPTITTTALSDVTNNSAIVGGNVTAEGGNSVTERGIVWATTSNPTTSNNKVIDGGTGAGAYTDTITGLSGAVTYHYRAYAINTIGTSYGADVAFNTLGLVLNNYQFPKVGDGMSVSEKIR